MAATNLPNGVTASWSNNVLTISGTPTETGIFNYAIPLLVECGGSSSEGKVVTGTLTVKQTPMAMVYLISQT